MSTLNKVQIIGNLGIPPELRRTKGGEAVATLSVATSNSYKTRDGVEKEETEWHRITVWGKQAETCDRFLGKGSKVYVEGRLQTRKWVDEDGNEKWSTDIVARTILFLDRAPKRDSRPHPADASETEVPT